ncbi:LysR family transcriptional regulator [Chachezhania antarctica]|uniref:LysR family transcriptional regulator n=1 Tax=Chachezhania antarctica TaxID=2340860 RepID=UPI000EB282D9|nr:LysR family transcriptional regulator [Chachezhania antarctica]|tara:strand:- start:2379 stop:3257 length:879 start_codon:yes stop_codon:yes gene_type:complete
MNADWDDLRTVLALVRHGTLAGAGAELGVSYTTVARRVQRTEKDMGEVLFERLADGYRPTHAARLVAEYAERMEAEQVSLLRKIEGRDNRLSGPLVVAAPQLLIGSHVAPVLDQFTRAYPGVELTIRATHDAGGLTRRGADVSIRMDRFPVGSLQGIRLCAQHEASFASPKLADRLQRHPDATIDWLASERDPHVPKQALEAFPNSRVRMVFDDTVAMIGAAQAGLGVVRLPMFLGRATAWLVQVPVLPPRPCDDIWAVAQDDIWRTAKVAAFRSMLAAHFRARRQDFVGQT